MKNAPRSSEGQSYSLADLKAKREMIVKVLKEIDAAIQSFENIEKISFLNDGTSLSNAKSIPEADKNGLFSNLGVYEATVLILQNKRQTLTTEQIIQELLTGGKELPEKKRYIAVASTLYKAVLTKKNCKIKKAGKGKWALA